MSIEQVATVSTVCALVISGHQIIKHLTNFTEPNLQRYIIRILLMIPVTILTL